MYNVYKYVFLIHLYYAFNSIIPIYLHVRQNCLMFNAKEINFQKGID